MIEFYPDNFAALPEEESSLEKSKAIILPLPYEATTTYKKGTKDGPKAIIEASRNMETYDDEYEMEAGRDIGIHTAGDLFFPSISPKDMVKTVTDAVDFYLKKNKFVVCIGGEHNLSYPIFLAHQKYHSNLGIVQLDAHADLRDSYDGDPFSHACVMRRIISVAKFILQIGIRSFSYEEAVFIKQRELHPVRINEMRKDGIIGKLISALPEQVYLTIDVDFFDPSIMPSTGTPEPDGAAWSEGMKIIKMLSETKKIVGFDIMEFSPIPGNVAPDFSMARFISKSLCAIFHNG